MGTWVAVSILNAGTPGAKSTGTFTTSFLYACAYAHRASHASLIASSPALNSGYVTIDKSEARLCSPNESSKN